MCTPTCAQGVIAEGKDDDPDQVDKVPEQPDDFHEVVVAVVEVSPIGLEEGEAEQADACGDVSTVESGDEVEGRRSV